MNLTCFTDYFKGTNFRDIFLLNQTKGQLQGIKKLPGETSPNHAREIINKVVKLSFETNYWKDYTVAEENKTGRGSEPFQKWVFHWKNITNLHPLPMRGSALILTPANNFIVVTTVLVAAILQSMRPFRKLSLWLQNYRHSKQLHWPVMLNE